MRWEEVKERFPNEWVVFEATGAYSKDGQREYCFFHTSRTKVIAKERYAMEVRPGTC
ncbi:hypothetical protein [Paenibacillus kribbensis]|uniref:hypothetical protein n=1 Tax=Paenibacillus kribbensis TaxID=172713 RepID=UPI0015BAE946|nr:hypothetical protein [Paenibacillus kribbensis]